jgi:hypothetical protein
MLITESSDPARCPQAGQYSPMKVRPQLAQVSGTAGGCAEAEASESVAPVLESSSGAEDMRIGPLRHVQ